MKTLADDNQIYLECLQTVALHQWQQNAAGRVVSKKDEYKKPGK
ncbi:MULTISPECIES: hypothetical protein [unclassified Janthinobacterium]|nr:MULTISPECIES: hypothetical protein [unclassified Janthinobacterium]